MRSEAVTNPSRNAGALGWVNFLSGDNFKAEHFKMCPKTSDLFLSAEPIRFSPEISLKQKEKVKCLRITKYLTMNSQADLSL